MYERDHLVVGTVTSCILVRGTTRRIVVGTVFAFSARLRPLKTILSLASDSELKVNYCYR